MSTTCYFCDEHERLEQHHIVPRRFGGSDSNKNLVSLCPTCHSKIEALYDKRFYDALGVENDTTELDVECSSENCTAQAVEKLQTEHGLWYMCDVHYECDHHDCSKNPTLTATGHGLIHTCCEDHGRCTITGCQSTDLRIVDLEYRGKKQVCDTHAEEYGNV